MTPMGKLLALRQRLRMRALSTGASRRGLAPTSRSASALVDPGDGGVEQIGRAAAASDRAPRRPGGNRGWSTPSRVIRSLSAKISSTAARSPTMRADRARAWPRFTLAAIAAKASLQVAGRKLAVLAHIGLVEPLRAQARRQTWRVLSEIHSSLTSSLRRGSTRITSRPRVSTRMLQPSASITSIEFGLVAAPRAAP